MEWKGWNTICLPCWEVTFTAFISLTFNSFLSLFPFSCSLSFTYTIFLLFALFLYVFLFLSFSLFSFIVSLSLLFTYDTFYLSPPFFSMLLWTFSWNFFLNLLLPHVIYLDPHKKIALEIFSQIQRLSDVLAVFPVLICFCFSYCATFFRDDYLEKWEKREGVLRGANQRSLGKKVDW